MRLLIYWRAEGIRINKTNTSKKEYKLRNIVFKYGEELPMWKRIIDSGTTKYEHLKRAYRGAIPKVNNIGEDYLQTSNDNENQYSNRIKLFRKRAKNLTNIHSYSSSASRKTSIYDRLDLSEQRWIVRVIGLLMSYTSAKMYLSNEVTVIEIDEQKSGSFPSWATYFNKMDGLVREDGRLLVQNQWNPRYLHDNWSNSSNYLLIFVETIYACRKHSYLKIGEEAFSDVIGASEKVLPSYLHATLIAGLAIVSMVRGRHQIEMLLNSILGVSKADYMSSTVTHDTKDQVINHAICCCSHESIHRPLSPVAAAKAIGLYTRKKIKDRLRTRVWDLDKDALVDNIEVQDTIFITHRWREKEINYANVTQHHNISISRSSDKLTRIRNVLLPHTKYIWIDTICIDKSNLSELDETIRSMYRWYANCRAVVLDLETDLKTWRSRGWCLQEGVAARALYGMKDEKELVSIYTLSKLQNIDLCTLDLSIYYRPGNAVEVLAMMQKRTTTRKEDMSYALAGIFSIHLMLAYGEGQNARKRLLQELAVQNGDISSLNFPFSSKGDFFPGADNLHLPINYCLQASTPAILSHFGLTIEVQLLEDYDFGRSLPTYLDRRIPSNMTESSSTRSYFNSTRKLHDFPNSILNHHIYALGMPYLQRLVPSKDTTGEKCPINRVNNDNLHQAVRSTSKFKWAIVPDIKCIMQIVQHGEDLQTGNGNPIKRCHRLACHQLEDEDYDRLVRNIDVKRERIWLGNDPRLQL